LKEKLKSTFLNHFKQTNELTNSVFLMEEEKEEEEEEEEEIIEIIPKKRRRLIYDKNIEK